MDVYGIDTIIRIVTHFIFIYLAFWSLGALRLDAFFKADHVPQVRMLLTLLSIGIGYLASSFVLELIVLSKNLFVVGF